jgi:transposase
MGMLKLKGLLMILELHQQGLTVSAIADRLGKDRKTVRKYISQGLEPPAYGPRVPRPQVIDPYRPFLRERLAAYPELSVPRLCREIRAMGYTGGLTSVGDCVRELRPPHRGGFEVRFETPAGHQAQVDFAHFRAIFSDEPEQERVLWLFSMVLGHSRFLWARFCLHQDLATVLRCHIDAFESIGGTPREILYDRMKTAVLGERDTDGIVYNRSMLALAQHYGFGPRACKSYRAKTKGKVERPYRYIRQDFFLGRTFRNLEDLNAQLRNWLDSVANVRLHGTTQRLVDEHFREELPALQPLPTGPFSATLELTRRVSHEGMVSVGGNLYSVPDGIRFIQVLLGHADLTSTQIYTRVSILKLQEIHAATHPARLQRRQAAHQAADDVVAEAAPADPRQVLLRALEAEADEEG